MSRVYRRQILQPPRLTAAALADALGGRRVGNSYVARCPAHEDQTPSLSISDSADGADSKVLIFCHAGCSQSAVIAALQARGLWSRTGMRSGARRTRGPMGDNLNALDAESRSRRDYGIQLWSEAIPIEGTIVQRYLRSRGITIDAPPSLRFHENLRHRITKSNWPAMIALITDSISAEPIGIHRTFLAPDGSGKAPIESAKLMLGTAKGGVIRLGNVEDDLLVGEGIETCLSVQQACGIPTWAALSASGLKALNLPPGTTRLTLLADGDPIGEAAAQAAARRLRLTVRTVRIVRAPKGRDFNDILTSSTDKEDGHD